MFEFLRQLVVGIAQAWQRLTVAARIQIGLAALLTLVLIGVAVFVGAQPQYARLFERLDLDESNDITVWLVDNDIPYRIRDGGRAIDIPVKDISRARVSLAALNIPKSQGVAPGFELFNNRDLMTNRFLQDVDYMRALQGTLQAMLNQYDFVRRSFVFIREAPEQLFVDDQRPSEATVMLDTTGPLTRAQVKAVLHTVSSFGGANLSPRNVSITLSDGTNVHTPSEDEFASLANDKLEVQIALEREREDKIRRAFDRMGVKAIINVSALMDWSSQDKKTREVAEGTIVSSLVTESSTKNTEEPPQGAPGAIANIPEELGQPGGSGVETLDSELIENFEPSETVTTTTTPPGSVRRYHVSAFIERPLVTETGDDGEEVTQPRPLTDDEIQRYSDFIKTAVGAGAEPTEVVVYDHPFAVDTIAAAQAALPPAIPFWQSPIARYGGQFAAMVIALLLIRLFMRRALVVPTVEEEEVVELPEISAAELRRQEIATEVERLSGEEPETVAALLRGWMTEED